MDYIKIAANVTPSEAQYNWNKTEFYAFAHFGVNTYTNREWGTGKEDPAIFNPTKFNANQWVDAVKSAGMRGLLLTAKHHDGFCLWQTETTDFSMKSSPYKDGKGDIVAECAEACKKGGIKFGVYLSPWDQNAKTYGQGKAYDDFYVKQLTELLTNYGELFTIWFDGACGEGENGKKQVYDWKTYLEVCKKLQPDAVTFNFGDIRWCGNEAGDCREAEWSVLPRAASSVDFILSQSQQAEDADGSFRKAGVQIHSRDMGSRKIISGEKNFIWYPCETDTSIRPGWFYHETEDDKVRSLDELMNIYYNSVGGNSCLLLNIPPTPEGLFHENDVQRLKEIGEAIKKAFAYNYASSVKSIRTSSTSETADCGVKAGCEIENALKDDENLYYMPEKYHDGDMISIKIEFNGEREFSKVVLAENIRVGQRIERFEIFAGDKKVYEGLTVGYKKIARFEPVKTDKLTINILESRTEPTLQFIGVY
jgi:alpha-L-fucosidase